MPSAWTWDPNRQDYYYVTQDSYGNYTYHYQNDQAHAASQPQSTHTTGATDLRSRNDSVYTNTSDPAPKEAVTIKGTPELGPSEQLDPSYQMRTGREAYRFFIIGKVFSMLHVQAASASDLAPISDNITVVKYGERAFSQIRRFVIVEVRRGFVYACPISTYSKRGTLKQGCIPSQHSVVYLAGTTPVMFTGENLVKQAICVNPNQDDPHLQMHPASRLHYGKAYLIEMNVKVKDIGDVDPEDLSLLLRYYREENFPDSSTQPQYHQEQTHPAQGYQQPYPNQTYPNPNPTYPDPNYPVVYRY